MKDTVAVVDRTGSNNGSKTTKKTKRPNSPRKYKVIYHNDNYTPMEFVTWSLMEFFNRTEIDAQSLPLKFINWGLQLQGDMIIKLQNKKYGKF